MVFCLGSRPAAQWRSRPAAQRRKVPGAPMACDAVVLNMAENYGLDAQLGVWCVTVYSGLGDIGRMLPE